MRAATALMLLLLTGGCGGAAPTQPAPLALPPPKVPPPSGQAPPAEFSALLDHVRKRATLWREGAPINSLVLDDRQTVLSPVAIDCQRRPPAVMIDLDDGQRGPLQPDATGVKTAAGWADAAAAIRAENVSIVWITDQSVASASALAMLLERAGLDPARADSVAGRDTATDRKQHIRQRLALRYCILAVVGDLRADADEAYDYLRSPDTLLPIDRNWGEGWFLLPPPLVVEGQN